MIEIAHHIDGRKALLGPPAEIEDILAGVPKIPEHASWTEVTLGTHLLDVAYTDGEDGAVWVLFHGIDVFDLLCDSYANKVEAAICRHEEQAVEGA